MIVKVGFAAPREESCSSHLFSNHGQGTQVGDVVMAASDVL